MQTDTFVTPNLVEEFTFPDGQPHLKVLQYPERVSVRIRNPTDLFKVQMLENVYHHQNKKLHLSILYLMAGRMDRRLSADEPATLAAVCHSLLWVSSLDVLCAHSEVTSKSLQLCSPEPSTTEETIFDTGIMNCILNYDAELIKGGRQATRDVTHSLVYPDKGACDRFSKYKFPKWHSGAATVVLSKTRELSTGRITGMEITEGTPGECCVIVDDLCDGGATFIGAAKCLREAGAKFVGLVVAHGIFSKGIQHLFDNGIDHIHTSNSFRDWTPRPKFSVTTLL